jgi:hypothetical protein
LREGFDWLADELAKKWNNLGTDLCTIWI